MFFIITLVEEKPEPCNGHISSYTLIYDLHVPMDFHTDHKDLHLSSSLKFYYIPQHIQSHMNWNT